MNNKILWLGIGVLIVGGLIVIGFKDSAHRIGALDTDIPTAEEPTTVEQQKPTAQSSTPTRSPSSATTPRSTPVAVTAPKDLMLDLSSSFARSHQEELSKFLKNPADFNNHYIVAKWQCGSDCFLAAVIDRNNGKVSIAPMDNYQTTRPGPSFVPYSLGANIYRIVNDNTIEVYSFDGGKFTLIDIQEL